MGHFENNKKAIERGFSSFLKRTQDRIRIGMRNIAQAGLLFLVDAHELFNIQDGHNHLNEDDTLAWAVAYNGSIVDAGDLEGMTDLPADDDERYGVISATEEAKKALRGSSGWVGIIYSSMMGWYRWDWETDYLNYSAQMLASDFERIFKRLDR